MSYAEDDTPGGLLGLEATRLVVFPDAGSRPSPRTWADWKAKGFFPYLKIGRRVFCDPAAVRKELDRKFTVHPRW